MRKRLVILGCSATKKPTPGPLPAVDRYDGPMYRVLRSFLRKHRWPSDLSVAVLSAEHGLIGGLTPIEPYDRRMSGDRAAEIAPKVAKTLEAWKPLHSRVDLVLGQSYLPAIEATARQCWPSTTSVAGGGIGMKLSYLRKELHQKAQPAHAPDPDDSPRKRGRPAYFLPDWDDFVDADFDFVRDRFSSNDRVSRQELHCSQLVDCLADGILVSLAQSTTGKGLLRSLEASSPDSLAPTSVKKHFGLNSRQWAFGDCGAFSYVNEHEPTISIEQAVTIYELFGFDLGASIDHIPVPIVIREGKRRRLTRAERKARLALTVRNADAFISEWRYRECRFHPVGVIQGITSEDYANSVFAYSEMGYRRLALGGLVPRSDREIVEIVTAVTDAFKQLRERPWLHLMGVYRPEIQSQLRAMKVDSFDSATYFRKAWLRSGQNYLGANGQWYAAIRVPPSRDPRTAKRLKASGKSEKKIRQLELAALRALRGYASGRVKRVDTCLKHVMAYDSLLDRAEAEQVSFADSYRRTLEDRPWEKCKCDICRSIGIDALIFRGLNRNKRRGAHNTLKLYENLGSSRGTRQR
ncbi:MAG: tRNA-guanine transglycosylase DpdA [Phycisphaerales bacterium]